MKYKLLAITFFIIQFAFSQSKKEYLQNNRFDLLSKDFELPKSNFKIIGFGAYHGSKETENAEKILLTKLMQNNSIKFYLPETDFGIAYFLNEFLKSGDTLLLQDLVKHYGVRVPQEKTIETYEKWKNIRELNNKQSETNKIQVIGTDLIVTYKYTIKLLLKNLTDEKEKFKTFDKVSEMIKIDTTDYSPYYDSYSKNILKKFVEEYEINKSQINNVNSIITENLIDNIKQTFVKNNREKIIYDNYVYLNQIYNFNLNPQFVRMGFFHIEKARENNNPSFFTRLIENNVYKKDEIISIAGFLTKSRVLWDLKYDKNNHYNGFTTEGGFGIGDYWKEYFKGISKLKKNKLSNLTLFKLNGTNSPYKENQTDLMEIKMFLKKSNKNELKGKTTTDYFDYAILMSNSEASVPIEEIIKKPNG